MSDRQYKAQLRRLRRAKKKANRRTSTSGSGKKKTEESALKALYGDSGSDKRKELLSGKL